MELQSINYKFGGKFGARRIIFAKSDTDTFESLLKKANDIAMLQPNFFGLGINLNNLIQKILPKKDSKKKTSK